LKEALEQIAQEEKQEAENNRKIAEEAAVKEPAVLEKIDNDGAQKLEKLEEVKVEKGGEKNIQKTKKIKKEKRK